MSHQQAQRPVRLIDRSLPQDEPTTSARSPAVTLVFLHAESAASDSRQIRLLPVAEFADAAAEIASQRPDLVVVPYETLSRVPEALSLPSNVPEQPCVDGIADSAVGTERAAIAAGLAAIRRSDLQLPVIVTVPASGQCGEVIIESIRAGASDAVPDAMSPEALRERMTLLAQRRRLQRRPAVRQHASATYDPAHERQRPAIVGTCEAMISNLAAVGRAAASCDSILICGEPGTGKSLFAHTLHRHSEGADKPPTVIDCGQCAAEFVDEQLLEPHDGRFQLRSELGSGTLIIENIDHASPRTQRRLIAALRRPPLSGRADRQAMPRLVFTCSTAGTSVPLHEAGTMASDCSGILAELYHELCGQVIQLPPLRSRGEDIAALCDHFIRLLTATQPIDHREHEHRITAEAKRALVAYDWPGNVAQLRSVLSAEIQQGDGTIVLSERLVRLQLRPPLQRSATVADQRPHAAADTGTAPKATEPNDSAPVHLRQLSSARAWSEIVKTYDVPATAEGNGASLYADAIQAAEAGLIKSVLESTDGNLTQAARLLGITRVSLRRKIHGLGLQIPGRTQTQEPPSAPQTYR